MSHLTSIDIRNGRLDREKGEELVEQYEGKKPASLEVFMDYIGIDEKQFIEFALQNQVSPFHLTKEEIENIFPSYEDYSVWPIEVYLASRISNIKEQQPESWASITIENEQLEEWIQKFTQSAIFMKIASEERRELLKIQLTQYFQPII